MSVSPIQEDAWIEFAAGVDVNPFPRDIGKYSPTGTYRDNEGKRRWVKAGYPRFQVETELDYLEIIERYRKRGVTSSIHSQYMVGNNYRSKIFIEVGDTSPIQIAHKQMQALCKTLYICYDVAPTVLFSANKSFHIYIPFHPLELKSSVYNVVDEVLRDILMQGVKAGLLPYEYNKVEVGNKKIKIKIPKVDIDWKVAKDINRTARLPYTYHIKSVLMGQPKQVVPIDWHWSLHKILEESKGCIYREEFKMDGGEGKNVRRLLKNTDGVLHDLEEREAEDIYKGDLPYIYTNSEHIYNGEATHIYKENLDRLMKVAHKIRDGRHRMTYSLIVPYLRHLNYIYKDAEAIYIRFILLTGEIPEKYLPLFKYLWERKDEKGEPYIPMRLDNFCKEYPELSKYFREVVM